METEKLLHKLRFKDKYRIPSARAAWWNYANSGAYFITICTANREHFFGEIPMPNLGLQETEMGELAKKYWYEIPKHFPYIQLGAFVVMPNHVHGILVIEQGNIEPTERPTIEELGLKLPQKGGCTRDKNPLLGHNISRVIRWYKGRCTYEMRKTHADFEWQPRFYDIIIKNDESYLCIEAYIETNPQKWKEDKFWQG